MITNNMEDYMAGSVKDSERTARRMGREVDAALNDPRWFYK